MDQILTRPEFQSAVIPFIVAFVVAAGLRKRVSGGWVWAMFAAFAAAALLINGLAFTPLTGTRKIILLVLGCCLVAALVPPLLRSARFQRSTATGLVLLSLLWVFWTVVARKDTGAILAFLAGASALVLWLAWGLDRARDHEVHLHAGGLALLLGTGLCAMAGSSALLGQLALALAAACGAVLLTWVIGGAAAPGGNRGPVSILPYLLPAVLIGLAATLFARLPWYALIPLSAIPVVTSLVPLKFESRFLTAFLSSLPGLIIAAATAAWIWQAGSSGASGY